MVFMEVLRVRKTIQSTKFIWISVPWYISNHLYHRIYHGTFVVSGVRGKIIALPCFLSMVTIVPPHNKVLSQLRFSTIPHQMNVNESIKLSPSRAFAVKLHWLPLAASFNARPTPLTNVSPGLTADSTPLTRCQGVWDSPADALRGASIARSPGGPFHRHRYSPLARSRSWSTGRRPASCTRLHHRCASGSTWASSSRAGRHDWDRNLNLPRG